MSRVRKQHFVDLGRFPLSRALNLSLRSRLTHIDVCATYNDAKALSACSCLVERALRCLSSLFYVFSQLCDGGTGSFALVTRLYISGCALLVPVSSQRQQISTPRIRPEPERRSELFFRTAENDAITAVEGGSLLPHPAEQSESVQKAKEAV
jgi:hypothetical protein